MRRRGHGPGVVVRFGPRGHGREQCGHQPGAEPGDRGPDRNRHENPPCCCVRGPRTVAATAVPRRHPAR
ncbi:hypothetical protein SBD_6472 [Streptomyces bottropensis ATCC 25435]|uniref:Uncharacterized protein n=1 Tax=Streptomyces bottropensis ATCC 25435 TaxID=1054862 RepID=M3FIT5_9ACTN|nr:hypothetical protein SBD_6472 [Streptomyces bottropensis ATCC 25435]